MTAEDALSQGLEAWLHPADWNNKLLSLHSPILPKQQGSAATS